MQQLTTTSRCSAPKSPISTIITTTSAEMENQREIEKKRRTQAAAQISKEQPVFLPLSPFAVQAASAVVHSQRRTFPFTASHSQEPSPCSSANQAPLLPFHSLPPPQVAARKRRSCGLLRRTKEEEKKWKREK
jgi:hypothetical protein